MTDASEKLTIDAIIFGLGYLNGPKATLSFGGDGAEYRITDRARSAMNCLLENGFAEVFDPTDQIAGREYYRGVRRAKSFGEVAKERGICPFDPALSWPSFERIAQ